MQKLSASIAMAVLLTTTSLPIAHACRHCRNRQQHHHRNYENYAQRYRQCEHACHQRYGIDGEKCLDLSVDKKKKCRLEYRACYKDCWNDYR